MPPKVLFQIWLEAFVPKDTLQMRSGREQEAPPTKVDCNLSSRISQHLMEFIRSPVW